MPELLPFLKKDDIDEMTAAPAHRISADCRDRELVLTGVLKGAFIFMSDLARHLTIPVTVDFISVSATVRERPHQEISV